MAASSSGWSDSQKEEIIRIAENAIENITRLTDIVGRSSLPSDSSSSSGSLPGDFYKNNTPIPTNSLRNMLRLILQENSFHFNGRNYLQTHGTAMGTRMAVAFANIFMSAVESKIIGKSKIKPIEWKRYIDVCSRYGTQTERK